MRVRALPQPGAFALDGELDLATVDMLLAETQGAPQDGDLVLDVSELTFMDSTGLRAILQIAQRRNGGTCVVLKHPTPAVERVLGITLPEGVPGLRVELNGRRDA